jgi:hypothetical protein
MENQVTSHIIKGLLLGLFSIVSSVIVSVFSLYEVSWINLINYGVLISGLIYGSILYANQNNNNVTFGNVFAHGFKTTSIVIVLFSAYTFLSIKYIFPDFKDIVLRIVRKKMMENPKLNEDFIEQNIKFYSKHFMDFTIGGNLIFLGILGAIGSVIGAAVAKKNPNPFEDNSTI